MTDTDRTLEAERQQSARFGFFALAAWASVGLLLETAHGLKLSVYLDHPQRRELFVLAHAHGVGLALVVLAYAALGVRTGTAAAGLHLRTASLLIPLGFAGGVLGQTEVDPGPLVWLVPVGALMLISALVRVGRALAR